MYKQAGLNAIFGTMDAIDGAKKTKTTYNNSENKYDAMMGTTVSKNITHKNGLNNAMISGPGVTASETLDLLCKQAGMKIPSGNDVRRIVHNFSYDAKKGINKVKSKVDDLDTKNTEHLKNMVQNAKNKNVKETLKEGARAGKVTIPALLGMMGAGVATTKTMKRFDKERSPEKDLEYNTIGTGISAGLILNALSHKKVLKPAGVMASIAGDKMMKYPLRVVKNNSKAGKVVVDVAAQVNKGLKRKKKASDELLDLEKLASFDAEYGKKLLNEHFLQKGKESIPYYVAPAALSFALGRNLRRGFEKEPKKKDDPEKVAGFKMSPKVEGEVKMNLEKGVEGLGRTIFPAALMAATGRDITNSFGRLEDSRSNKSNMQNSMANGIVIQVSGDGTKRKIKRDISKQLDTALSKQADTRTNGFDIGDVADNADKDINHMLGDSSRIKTNKISIGNGVKKNFRMQK